MEFVIITGPSGAGKTHAMHVFEDIGFYCVDNIPTQLLETFYDLCLSSKNDKMKRIVTVADVRTESLNSLFFTLKRMREKNKKYKILFLTAKDSVLVQRFVEGRRKHPLQDLFPGSFPKAIEHERELLENIRLLSDYIIDTSNLSMAQLKERVSKIFLSNTWSAFKITCMSFGFKYGTPYEADLMFDARCFPNPYYVKSLKELSGLENEVKDYVLKFHEANVFLEKLISLLDYMLPLYKKEGKSQLVIAIGCTGGKHRSVVFTEEVYSHLLKNNYSVIIQHRDIKK